MRCLWQHLLSSMDIFGLIEKCLCHIRADNSSADDLTQANSSLLINRVLSTFILLITYLFNSKCFSTFVTHTELLRISESKIGLTYL